jgi:CDGSH-type Zn-finger protein
VNHEHRPAAGDSEVIITPCPGGPVLVRGAAAVISDGERSEVNRPVVAVCACGKSSRRPWCDGTHKVIRRNRP